ncbi:hypothetical protein F5Y00DRAFT_212219 [Daldinia vernicosa]|uniref:uncharacterized protein n=1 Tax=Daldinia vernicosa TaxID=114800 RepID=UPI0020077197|nr:uncharacterized protein F5Y00DRAFT_212219 [Daldinia vernicosa]KAI0844063.1 hypothetical protein F5Y00DRAFT_212219 [Daldinia vernicosa]
MEEESDIEDRVAYEHDEDLDEYDLDEYDSDESGFDGANPFLDMEAAESDDESDNSEDASPITEQFFFPQFRSLPPELRARIWEFFDPSLRAKARVFHMLLRINPMEFWRSAPLIEQTAPARAMLATHHESRALALKSYPDTLDVHRGRGVIRYNSERDVVLLSISSILAPTDLEEFFSSLGNTKYLAFNHLRAVNEEILYPRLATHPTLKGIFYCYDCYELPPRDLTWCISDSIQRFYIQQIEYDTVLGPQPLESMYCWPDLENHRKFAEEHAQATFGHAKPLKIWTMVEFAFEQGFKRYERLEASGGRTEEWSSDTESGYDSNSASEDEYESEGIDDATIHSDGGSNEDEDDLVVQSGSDEDNSSTFDGFSPIQDENPELHLDGEIEIGIANFSSFVVPESPNHYDNASEQDDSDEEPVQKTARRKRRIVSSDDEDDINGERDEEVKMPSRPAKRSRIVLSDTEDEDDEDGDEDTKQGHNISYESEESDEPEDEDEEPVKTKSMSLFEKLKQYRQENPLPPDSEASSDVEASMGSEGLDAGNNINFPDDETEDEHDLLENGGIGVDMSEERSEGDEDDEDGW